VLTSFLEFEDFFKMFGYGRHENIKDIFDNHLAPFMSSAGRGFWASRLGYFTGSGLYFQGGMGWIITIVTKFFPLIYGDFCKKMMEAKDMEEQYDVWYNQGYRDKILGTTKLMDNRMVMWITSGVPTNQLGMIREGNGTLKDYLARVMDQLVVNTKLSENYFYRLCMTGSYTKECCPRYLTEEGFEALKSGLIDRLELRVCPLDHAISKLYDEGTPVTKVVLMDHIDWMDEEYSVELATLLNQKTSPNAEFIFRSASQYPWYADDLANIGQFEVTKVNDASEYADRVNMYASFYHGVRRGNDSTFSHSSTVNHFP
jgi:betaine lipid synthase